MSVRSKLGLSIRGDYDSPILRRWMRRLDAAGIGLTAVFDVASPAFVEAQALAQANPTAGHTVVYRSSGPAEPDYAAAPEQAAAAFWGAHQPHIPVALDPAGTWLELMKIGEVGVRNPGWLGAFAVALARLTLAEGYRTVAFSFGAGQPPFDFWSHEAIVAYLRLCEAHSDRLGIALHEFSRRVDDIWYRRDEHLGRLQSLFSFCDRAEIRRPLTVVTSWGWTPDLIPSSRRQVLDELAAAAAFYARFPEVCGVALHQVGDEPAGIERQVRRLIRPLTAFTLAAAFEPTPQSLLPTAPESVAADEPRKNAQFINDATIPDDSRMAPGTSFIKTWRVRNSGTVDWDAGYALVHVEGELMATTPVAPLPAVRAGEIAEISLAMTAPTDPGSHYSDWRFRDAAGGLFGDIVYVRIEVVPAPAGEGLPGARFVADVTVPDDSEVAAGSLFTKIWRVRNSGDRAWGAGDTIRFVGGAMIAAAGSYPLPAAAPGQEVDISIPMAAPLTPGTYYADWRLIDAGGNPFGDMVYVRFVVPGKTLVAPISQQDPRWASAILGDAGSSRTIGEWGCLLVVLSMTATALGKETDPLHLGDRLRQTGGFLDLYKTSWDALGRAYSDVVFNGRVEVAPDLFSMVNTSLAAGVPVPVQVDFTTTTPYTDDDQHWVLIVGRDGDDYRINDPYLWPPQQASLRERYGRAGQPLQDAILSALFHRRAGDPPFLQPWGMGLLPIAAAARRLGRGMNVNPDAPHSNPYQSDELKGLDWVRFVFKLSARVVAAEREDMDQAFAQYDPIIAAYAEMGIGSLMVLNQETVWGVGPWTGNNDWETYAEQFAAAAGRIAARYSGFGAGMAYQIWNEGDKRNNAASVHMEPEQYALVLARAAAAIRTESPESPIIFNGMATGPSEAIRYVNAVRAALGSDLPVDAIGIHPYTRWGTRAPFDWGERYGTLGEAFATYRKELPDLKLWITEIGVADDDELGPQYYAEIADYYRDVHTTIAGRYASQVPVVIWFAWSDWMRNAGIVRRDGARKEHLFAAYDAVRNRVDWR